MNVKIDDEIIGRIVIELFSDIVPKTAENFLALCIGNHFSQNSGKKLHYKGTIFHKIVRGLFIQGGDVVNLDGSSGESVFGLPFEDENYALKHDRAGVLSAVNSGQNQNNSQFIITVGECSHLDGSCVVFGQVRKGLACVIEISEVKTEDSQPMCKCVIEDCGQLLPNEPWSFGDNDGTSDTHPPDPRDLDLELCNVVDYLNVLSQIRESGNYFFARKNFIEAGRKYKKAIRYINFWISQKYLKGLSTNEINDFHNELEKINVCCSLNLAAVLLKKGLFRQSYQLCDEVVNKEKNNAKAYYRRGMALKHLNDFEGALKDQKMALSLLPNNKSIMDEINEINSLKKKYLLHEKKVFSRMFHEFL
ncbi:40 kDa peptidyl-prolyl cis-trans isomerase, putative [Pediculus humanus corporis]|uniref:peptidylprolyl isomerase n=1 Tax=Pediculus humanus subsp. corporis TaxID=121224 RepID=E0VW64_PEDHC|nr:40 kDa peptidyl-prolyl cis-trans isomerase, putative [Pediculus humanus corporis]EEB17620.1 40 kDa peptidyl-prolyl cis-trans isomerase, putative [Pediculus humanus corporis]